MIRTTRAQAGVDRVQRRAVDVPVDLGPRERELYALSTDLLRNVMVDSGDTMRRRSLALRLTASPFSMGTTAMRMAERHPNPRVRSVLNEVGHLAMDIQGSARENRAIEITRDWVREHGRVLIFTQHTDTVTGLLRRMDREGLQARSFHGSMSPSERAKTIAAFRSGEAPIMISTDAGAEGQNLQFCNCVLNYDLPWNPMRIEQRIGRVDRLTQPRDEVFVANLYARGTIDESVYQLLALKLRMFELLFGQVTTILGELDDAKSASFETRVMEALFADNDSKMQGLLTQLGTELAQARDRASTLIATDSGLSNWMASAFEHRKDLTKAGSRELVPEVGERTRMRQRRVQTWTREVLAALDATVLHDTGDGEGAFLTAQFDEEFEQELGGRTVMHLAFDRIGLEQHPDAELCAVGSPVFDELLGLLRMRGDMHATVPVIPEDIGPSPYKHAPTLKLVRRQLIPSGSWSGHATFRATIGEAETTEHLITADINGHNQQRLPRRPLQDGETLPAVFDTPSKVVAQFEKSAAGQLESLRRDREHQVTKDQAQELKRIAKGYSAQIHEAAYEDKLRLSKALRSEEKRLSRQPDIRARAKVLAVTLNEDDWIVEEIWSGPSGAERGLTYEWGLDEALMVESDVSGEAINVLALCSNAHWIDESESTHCESCDEYLCKECGTAAVFADCPVCGAATCGGCRTKTNGLCGKCVTPVRAPELDEENAVAWLLNGGTTLLVGERMAQLIRPGGWTETLVPSGDIADRERARLRSYAASNSLPADCGLTFRDLTKRPMLQDETRVKVNAFAAVAIELSLTGTTGSAIDREVVSDLPIQPDVRVRCEQEFRLESLLQTLRRDVPPPAPPAVLLTRRSTFTDFYLEADRLVKEITIVGDDGTLKTKATEAAQLQWITPSAGDGTLATADLDGVHVTVQARNEALLVNVGESGSPADMTQWIAGPDELSLPYQLGSLRYLNSLGTPGGRLGKRAEEPLSIAGPFPTPSECSLVNRDIKPVVERVAIEFDSDAIPADTATLQSLGIHPDHAAVKRLPPLPDELKKAFLHQAQRPFTDLLYNGFEVTETWQGHSRATHTYRSFDGEVVFPKLDDSGFRETDFGVCRDGHFYAAGTSEQCGACHSWACRACDPVEGRATIACTGCSTSVCRRCSTSVHTVPQDRCLLCDDHACSDCGREPQVAHCPLCDRTVCGVCRIGEVCPACSNLHLATEQELTTLPPELAAVGTSALIGSDANATVVILNRGKANEQAIIRSGLVAQWIAFGRSMIDDDYRLRLASSNSYKTQVVPIVELLQPEAALPDPHIVVETERTYCATWSIPQLGVAERSAALFARPEEKLASLVTGEFPPTVLLPQPAHNTPHALARVLKTLADPSTTKMVLRWERRGHDVAITPVGILEVTQDRTTTHRELANWEQDDTGFPAWVSQAWQPQPRLLSYASGRRAHAAIVEVASLRVLGVRRTEQTDWYVIRASENACAATALSRLMGLGDADCVSAFTDPAKLRLSTVTNAAVSPSLKVDPVGALTTGPRVGADTTSAALAAWAPTARIVAPETHPLSAQLAAALERAAGPTGRQTTLTIGSHVNQHVTVHGGNEWQYDRVLAAGQTDARRISNATGQAMDVGMIDREGHFGVNSPPCDYCGGLTCSVCMDRLMLCACCTTQICRRCADRTADDLLLCPACLATRPPTRKEAREHGRLFMTRRMLIGTDQQHTVVFELVKDQWTRQVSEKTGQTIDHPAAAEFLSHRLAGSETSASKQ